MSSPPEESEEKETQETQYIMSETPDLEESLELRLDTQTQDDLTDSEKNNTSSSDEGKFTAPMSRASLHTSSTSTDEKLFITASQDTISLSESDDTFSKSTNLSESKDSPDFENSIDPAVLTPNVSDDIKPSNSQDIFVSTSSGNQTLNRLSQRNYGAFISSTPRLRDSSSDDSPAAKKVKLDPDADSSVEIISKTSHNSSILVSKSDTSIEDVSVLKSDNSMEEMSVLKSDASMEEVLNKTDTSTSSPEKKLVQSQDSANTILLDSNNWTAVPAPPATESDFTLHYTQSGSQVKELTDVEASKCVSNGVANFNEIQDSSPRKTSGSWGSHNYGEFSYDSHCESRKNPSAEKSKLKLEDEQKTLDKAFMYSAGPFRAVFKEVFCAETNKLLCHEILELSFAPDEILKENGLSFSSLSSGVLGDLSSGSSGVCSLPGPFTLRPQNVALTSSSESNGDSYRRRKRMKPEIQGKYHIVNGNKVFHTNAKMSPSQNLEKVPVKCGNCKYSYPTPQLSSPSSFNGTTNGKPEFLSVNSSGRLNTPDNSSPFSASSTKVTDTRLEASKPLASDFQRREIRSSSGFPITYQEFVNSRENPFNDQSIVFGFWSNMYYPCRILSSSDDKYMVSFLDTGAEKLLSKNKLIPMSMLCCSGTTLKVLKEGAYVIGELQSICTSSSPAPFVVKVGNEIINCTVESIAILESQRKMLVKINNPPPATNFSSIDLDNCCSSKRNRTPRQSVITSMTTPRTGKSARKLFKNVECKASTSEPRSHKKSASCKAIELKSWSSDSDFEFKQYELDLSGNGIREVQLEKKDFDDPLNDLKQKNFTSSNDDKDLIEKFGPIPVKGSNLFSGFVFVLTCTDGTVCKSIIQQESLSSETETDQGDEFPECKYPFSKSRLITQIKAGGGVYYDNITQVPFNELKNTILISNKPSLTCTYIYALAEGIRAYTHDNVIHCCVNSIPFKEFIESNNYLPNGWSYTAGYKQVAKKKSVEGSLRPKLFKDMWILLLLDARTKDACVNFWTAILEIAGAQVKRNYAEVGTDESPVFAIADESCPLDILKKKDVRCVSVVWLIQSLINNVILKANNHPHFKHDFKSGPSDDST